MPGFQLSLLEMVIPPLIGMLPINEYINPYYWVVVTIPYSMESTPDPIARSNLLQGAFRKRLPRLLRLRSRGGWGRIATYQVASGHRAPWGF